MVLFFSFRVSARDELSWYEMMHAESIKPKAAIAFQTVRASTKAALFIGFKKLIVENAQVEHDANHQN